MLAKAEIYALVALGLVLAAIAAGAYERHVGYQERANEDSGVLEKANARADDLSRKLIDAGHVADQALEDERNKHAIDLSNALSRVKPVILQNCPSGGKLPQASPTVSGTASPSTGSADVSVPAGRDIGTALVMLAGECQQDRDKLIGWQDREKALEGVK